MYKGQYFQLLKRNQMAELVFDSQVDQVNTLTKAALEDLEKAIAVIQVSSIKGLIIRSGKKLFSAGADVKAFRDLFGSGASAVDEYLSWAQGIYSRLEALAIPKVAILNGVAAGGAVELSLLAEYRLGTPDMKVSLPEVKLGIMPAWGGMTRLPRLLGLDTSLEWLTTGKNFRSDKALTHHFLDGVIDPKSCDVIEQAEALLLSCIDGDLDWQARQKEKQSPLTLSQHELQMSLNVAKGMVAKVAGRHYPAPSIMLKVLEKSASCGLEEALAFEREGVVECIDSGVADALVSFFLSDMMVKAKTKTLSKGIKNVEEVGVIGAGIMGGGIAYVTADKGINVVMKDLNKAGLDLGLDEANKLLAKQVVRGRKSPLDMGKTLNRIIPTLNNAALESTDLVIEAVVENPKVKGMVLAELETVAPNAIIASNTSTLEISGLAKSLKKPENFCGIHFFNPVHKMPLVEVIKGDKTSDETIKQAVNYVKRLGKTPIVINDCPGFLVNRCLSPYFLAFNQLVLDGANIQAVDKVMSKKFGWPMGPAHLLDVIGLDTSAHCIDVMDQAFPVRMAKPEQNIIQSLVDKKHYGQKTGQGFYQFVADKRGRVKPVASEETAALIATMTDKACDFDEHVITMRMMVPMMFEAIRCLDEGVIASPQEADVAMVYGTGFPVFRGGIFYYMDQIGAQGLLDLAKEFEHLGALYAAPASLNGRAKNNTKFYA